MGTSVCGSAFEVELRLLALDFLSRDALSYEG
jgi:hypothetical protein